MSPPSLDKNPYISLTTYRRNGKAVSTPVWFARADNALYIFSAADAGKVKRLRNSSRAQVADCNYRGKVLSEWRSVEACLLDESEETSHAYELLQRKYGLQMTLTNLMSRIAGRINQRQVIKVVLG